MMKYDYQGYAFGLQHLLIGVAVLVTGMLCSIHLAHAITHLSRVWVYAAYVGGFVGGAIAAFCFCVAAVYWYTRLFVAYPTCRNGVCKTFFDYDYLDFTLLGWIGIGRCHYRCRCNDEYLRLGRRFMILKSDATIERYVKLSWRGEWIEDHDPDVKHYRD